MRYSFVLLLIILLAGCTQDTSTCGDGVCDRVERERGICPEDCGQKSESAGSTVLYIGFMVHLEGWNNEETNKNIFDKHAEAARALATLFEKYGAKATFEAKPEFVKGCKVWNDNVLKELHIRGHGIGVHADMGGLAHKQGLTQREFTARIAEMKKEMELVTGLQIRHASGICSTLDWVKAAVDAGYEFTSGSVGYCAMSLPVDKRPVQYKDCPNPAVCHGVFPVDLKNRITPWRASTGINWLEHDPQGELVILVPSGGILHLGEEKNTRDTDKFTEEDIDAFIQMVDDALKLAKPGRVNILYVGLSMGDPAIDENVYQKWFNALQPYIDSGQVEWKTFPEMYDLYIQWEQQTQDKTSHFWNGLLQKLQNIIF